MARMFLNLAQIIMGLNLRKNHEKQDGHKKVVGPIKAQEAERARPEKANRRWRSPSRRQAARATPA